MRKIDSESEIIPQPPKNNPVNTLLYPQILFVVNACNYNFTQATMSSAFIKHSISEFY